MLRTLPKKAAGMLGWALLIGLFSASACGESSCEIACTTVFERCTLVWVGNIEAGDFVSRDIESCGDLCADRAPDCERCFNCLETERRCSTFCEQDDSCSLCFPQAPE